MHDYLDQYGVQSCFSQSDRRKCAVPSEDILPLRCAIDLLLHQQIFSGLNTERQIADTYAIFRLLIQRGASVETLSTGYMRLNDAQTPLHVPCKVNYIVEFVRCLIEEGVNVNTVDESDNTPLQYCAAECTAEIVRVLLEKGANVKAKNSWEWSPLHAMFSYNTPLS